MASMVRGTSWRHASRVALRALNARGFATIKGTALTMPIRYRISPLSAVNPFGSWSDSIRYFSAAAEGVDLLEINVPEMGESITEGTIVEWNTKPGELVEEDQIIVSIETDKITVEVRSERAGVLTKTLFEEGDVVTVGQKLAEIDPSATPSVVETEPASDSEAEPIHVKDETPVSKSPAPPKQASVPNPPTPSINAGIAGEVRKPLERIRQRTAERLKEAQNVAAILTTFNEVDMSALIDLRNEYKEAFLAKHGTKLGFMSAFVKACTVALQEQKVVNAYIDGTDIVYRDFIDINVAVATPRGLLVPAIRGCEKMSFADIEKTIFSLGEAARTNKLSLEAMQGGTFTISNGGVFGSLMSTPIINMPQSAILGMHKIQKRPVVVNDEVVVRPMMYLALSYDHRLIDGREAVTFLVRVKTLIEDPRRLLLEIDI